MPFHCKSCGMNIGWVQLEKKRHKQVRHHTKSNDNKNRCEPTGESRQGIPQGPHAVRITQENPYGESEQEPDEIKLIEKTQPEAANNQYQLPQLLRFAITEPNRQNRSLKEVH